jgi:predicted TIM-barrel fold metal-dependent hydrolase
MIVDCHTHINGGVDEAAETGHSATETVDVCIVLADAEAASSDANEQLSEYVGRHRGKMVGFAHIEPTKDDISVKNLNLITDKLGLSGAVLYCCGCGFHPAHSRAMRFYESAQKLGLPLFFHNGWSLGPESVLDYAQPFLLDEVARTFPELKIVIGTMGAPFVEQTLSMVVKHENVYADLTISPSSVWQVYNIVVSAYERGVMDKLLFGSNFPAGNAGQCIETLLGFNKLLADTSLPKVPRGNIQNIIERDTLKLLGIQKTISTEVQKA